MSFAAKSLARARDQKAYAFKAPPRVGRLRIALLGAASAFDGWRDGRAGLPAPDDPNPPAAAQRRVDQANSWMSGKLDRRYGAERGRLRTRRHAVEARSDAIAAQLSGSERPDVPSALLEEPPAGDHGTAPSATPTRAARDRGAASPVSHQSSFFALLVLVAIFACEAIVNKKAFELFSETDTTLWLMVGGLAVGIVMACRLLGRSWKASESDESAVPMLLFLAAVALAAAVLLGSMRYLTVDNERQVRIRILTAQVAEQQDVARALSARLRGLQNTARLSLSQREELRITTSRIDAARAEVRSAASQLAAERTPHGIERAEIAVPLFVILNIFLMGVASALSYSHYNPAAEKAAVRRRREARERRRDAISRMLERRHTKREGRRHGRDVRRIKRRRKRFLEEQRQELLAQRVAYDAQKAEHAVLQGQSRALSVALDELPRMYASTCGEAEQVFESIVKRYWAAQNRRARRAASRWERDWRRGCRRALKKGLAAPERPAQATWQRPLAQDARLRFERPHGLVAAA